MLKTGRTKNGWKVKSGKYCSEKARDRRIYIGKKRKRLDFLFFALENKGRKRTNPMFDLGVVPQWVDSKFYQKNPPLTEWHGKISPKKGIQSQMS